MRTEPSEGTSVVQDSEDTLIKHKIALILILLALVRGSDGAVSATEQVTMKDLIFIDTIDPETGAMKGGVLLREDWRMRAEAVGKSEAEEEYADTCDSCVPLVYSGDPGTKLDVVFIATHFYPEAGPGSLFAENVDLMLQHFFEFPQFAANLAKMNFYRVDCIDPNDECVELGMNPICYNKDKLRALAARCPGYDPDNNDQIVVLFNGSVAPFTAALGELGFAYMPSNMHLFMVHEFGHSFAGLGDEYEIHVATTNLEPAYPNCASSKPGFTCTDKWGDMIGQGGVGCYSGCKYTNWYRSTFNDCVERDHSIDHFCPVCERHVDSLLNLYSDVPTKSVSWGALKAKYR